MGKRLHVCIVDDSAVQADIARALLEKAGHSVVTYRSGADALQNLRGGAPDCILLDIMMPGLDGLETLRELRRIAPRAEVILVTGHPTPEAAAEARALGAFDFLAKPVLLPHLRRVLEQAVLKSRSRAVEP